MTIQFIIGAVDLQMATCLRLCGYRFYNVPLLRQLLVFPLRPFSLLLNSASPSKHLSYWHLEHTSKEHIPVLFIHGIGVGLHFYLDFLKRLRRLNREHGIGVICLEVLPVSSRITQPILQSTEMTIEIQKILRHHGWSRCMIVSHSYGSVIATHLLRNPETSSSVGPLLFVDPVAFSFHSPQVPWNFLRRNPTSASEIQLQYFASMDPDVSHTLTRRFVWPDNSLWREDVEHRTMTTIPTTENGENVDDKTLKCTVALSGKDIIVDTDTLGRYLTRNIHPGDGSKWYEQENDFDRGWKDKRWTGEGELEVIYCPERNHAEIFEDGGDQDLLVRVVERYVGDG